VFWGSYDDWGLIGNWDWNWDWNCIVFYCALGVLGRWDRELIIWRDGEVLWNPNDCIMALECSQIV
jgi:hypothetical protein